MLSVRSLRIHNIDHSDYGEYKCVASNPLGIDQQVMYLYGTFSLFSTPESGYFKTSVHLFAVSDEKRGLI